MSNSEKEKEKELKYLYLTLTKSSSTKGKNEEIWLEELAWEDQAKILKLAQIGAIKESYNNISFLMKNKNGIFKEKKQPVGNKLKAVIQYHSMEEWDDTLNKYQRMGAEIQETTKKVSKKISSSTKESFTSLDDQEVQEFLDFLRSYQEEFLQQSFTMSVTDVSDERLEAASKILQQMVTAVEDLKNGGNGISVSMFNDLRHKLHMKIPRAIANVRKDDAKRKTEFEEKVKEDLSFYEFFKEQVEMARSEKKTFKSQTILKAFDLQMSVLKDKDEIKRIKDMMGGNRSQVSRIFAVNNNKTEKFFNNYCKKKNLSLENGGVTELFHGSGTENWWSIFANGLYLKPEALGITICGKAFGHGIYFANKAQKSIGYTSYCGSYWKGGNDNKAYLAIFKVATGEVYDIYGENKGVPDNYKQLQEKHPGADCTWAFSKSRCSNSYLQNEEIIVYTDSSINNEKELSQATIEYIIEIDRSLQTLY